MEMQVYNGIVEIYKQLHRGDKPPFSFVPKVLEYLKELGYRQILSNKRIKEEIEKATVEGALLEVNHHGTLEEHELAIGYRVAEAQQEQTLKAVGEWLGGYWESYERWLKSPYEPQVWFKEEIDQLNQGKMPGEV